MALCESCGQALPETLIKGDLIITTSPPEALWKGVRIPSTPTRVRLLQMLVQLGRVSSTSALLILPGPHSADGALKVHIAHLRRELEMAQVPIAISAVWGWGYELFWRDEP